MSDDFKFYESFTKSENLQTFDENELFELIEDLPTNEIAESVVDYSFIEREHPKYASGSGSRKRKISETENWTSIIEPHYELRKSCDDSEKVYFESEAKTYHNLTSANPHDRSNCKEELLWPNEVELYPFEDKCDQLVKEIEQFETHDENCLKNENLNFEGAKLIQKSQLNEVKDQHKKNKITQNNETQSHLFMNQKAKNLAQNIQSGSRKLLSKSKSFKNTIKVEKSKENGGILRNYQSEPFNNQHGSNSGIIGQKVQLKIQNYQVVSRNQQNEARNQQNCSKSFQVLQPQTQIIQSNPQNDTQRHSKTQNGNQTHQPDWQYHNYLQQQSHFGFVPHQYSNVAHNFFPAPPQEVTPLPPTAIIYTQEQKTLTCEICVRTFKTTSNLVRHFNSKTHQNKLEIKRNSFKNYKMSPLSDITEEEKSLLWQIDDEIYEFLQELEIEKKKTTTIGSFPTPPLTPLPS